MQPHKIEATRDHTAPRRITARPSIIAPDRLNRTPRRNHFADRTGIFAPACVNESIAFVNGR
ncbi:hypothetical protein GLA29479_2608 [Lysobacter antibioticus]|uniref:Uncharacterized protein n=1 Tax=Lysobacter antibioticus TaxID=84531 RepID=A0A0S2DXY2_LYSAN|nr:hypothetical protein GLA29479_2608 [Lysobacter antibioticus]ALN78696.1 hypothetical protein LA76x_0535 [Lysobacter antibioticus]